MFTPPSGNILPKSIKYVIGYVFDLIHLLIYITGWVVKCLEVYYGRRWNIILIHHILKEKVIHLPAQKIFNDIHSKVCQPPVESISMIQSMLPITSPLTLFYFLFQFHLYPLKLSSCRIIHHCNYLVTIDKVAAHWPKGLGGPNLD